MSDLRSKTVCFTGHRKIPLMLSVTTKRRLKITIENLIERGYCYFGAGGALGFDTLAAQTVLELKEKYPNIRLILILPCPSQADRWSDADKKLYESIKKSADKVVYTSNEYSQGCMHMRNRYLVDNSSLCVCYQTKKNGGTAYTVNYAKKKKLEIINLAEKTKGYLKQSKEAD